MKYDPDHLLASIIGKLKLKNDAALSRALEVAPPVISKIRHRRLPVGASLLIRMHEVTDLSIAELRSLMGDRRNKFRISDKQFKPGRLSRDSFWHESLPPARTAGFFARICWHAKRSGPPAVRWIT